MSGYMLALDQGTTSSRAIIFDDHARPVCSAQQETQLVTPKSGYVEQDAMQIWHTQLSCVNDVIAKAGLLATDIAGIAITNQRETTVVWDKKTGEPLAPAIIWQDRRTTDWCEQQKQNSDFADRVQSITGLRIDPYFSASKLLWLIENNQQIREILQFEPKRVAFGTIDSWLIYKLTGGEHLIDVTNASRTLLFDLNNMCWSDELLTQFNIPKSTLPTVLPSDGGQEGWGKTKKGLFAKQLPILAVLGDQQAALYGQGCLQNGMAKNTYGTGCFMLMNVGNQPIISKQQLLTTVAWQQQANLNQRTKPITNASNPSELLEHSVQRIKQAGSRLFQSEEDLQTTYALEGSVFMAGAIVQWLRDNLGMFKKSEQVEKLAMQVADTDGVVLVPAFTGLGAPYWQPNATASISGMTRGTNKAHIARASLEAIAFQTYDVLQAMQKDSDSPLAELRVDGGASNNDLLMQFQADLLGVPVLRPKDTEITAKGVALMAGCQSGFYDESVIDYSWQLDKAFEPSMGEDERMHHLQKWHRAVKQVCDIYAK